MAPIVKLQVSEEQRRGLLEMVRAPTRDALRARMMLLRSEGKPQKETALEVGVAELAVRRWEKRFRTGGIAGLTDTWGRHRKDPVPLETVLRVVRDSLQPPSDDTHWTLASMARHAGISRTQVHRIWSAHGLEPHRRAVEFSRDKFWDVIGLSLDPPGRLLVLCCDKQTHRLAMQRTQPGLPLASGPSPPSIS